MSEASVCIVTYNSADDIEDCLHAVLRQSSPVRRIVIVDNASCDDTCARIAALDLGPRLTLLRNRVNNGFAGGQNQAIAQTDTPYVLVLNPDVRLHEHYLRETIAELERQPRAGSACGQLLAGADPQRMDSAGLGLRATRQAYDLGAGEPASQWQAPLDVFGVSGAAAVYKRAMIEAIAEERQFFDEDFFAYKEDVDAAWRARHAGWTARYVPAARAWHHRGWKKGGRRAMPLFVRRHSYQNRFFVLIKNERLGWHWLWRLPLLAAAELAKLGYILLREPGLLACWPVILRLLPRMLRKRRAILKRAAAPFRQ
ncbi:glycosyltransferase family 2 protein [Paenibacillus sp. IB182496]|uniref:Glycosyltransferase family 2 protein n=1 Tax=Paenibacillus sabuli TaxID=2772509 RepID=A0A927BU42_9BACL|nr:glycosyltransferase family 2 protein [Paenibacillus sabuli]MBD2845916.1 glycosyltransferase family 2 protein [Paenibacillus sabuli]